MNYMVVFICFLLSIAFADNLRYPDAPCPAGSHRTVNHTGNWCTPATCTSDSQCLPPNWDSMPKKWKQIMVDDKLVCRSISMCVHSRKMKCEGGKLRKGDKSDCSFTKAETVSLCADGRLCSRGKCEKKSVCVAQKKYKKIQAQTNHTAALEEQEKLKAKKAANEEASGCTTIANQPSWFVLVFGLVWIRRWAA